MLEVFPIFDLDDAISVMGNIELVRTILPMMTADETMNDVTALKQAFQASDWGNVERLAHKIKGGASSCGTIRMKYACQYLERYIKAGHTKQIESLYHQCINVINETQQQVTEWLASQD